MYNVIVVGTDGSEKANEAVKRALELSLQHEAELHAITVVNTARYGEPVLSSKEMVITELEDRGNEQLKEIREMGSEKGRQIITKCFHGDPSQEILNYAQENDADLIVLGSHGHTHPRSIIGSTANRVLNGSSREVLIV